MSARRALLWAAFRGFGFSVTGVAMAHGVRRQRLIARLTGSSSLLLLAAIYYAARDGASLWAALAGAVAHAVRRQRLIAQLTGRSSLLL